MTTAKKVFKYMPATKNDSTIKKNAESGLFMSVSGCSFCRSSFKCSTFNAHHYKYNAELGYGASEYMTAALALERVCLIVFCGTTVALTAAFFIYGYKQQEPALEIEHHIDF